MHLRTLSLSNFRAHVNSTVAFQDGVNVIHGPNGAGKTNILEAVHYLALAKSFLTANDQYVLRRGARIFHVEGDFKPDDAPKRTVRCVYEQGQGKAVLVNGVRLERLADIVGRVPLVVVHPGDHELTSDGPEVRRRFVNNVLSQSKPAYLDDLLKYRRALRQRNALLMENRRSRAAMADSVLEPWNVEVAKSGGRIVNARRRFAHDFSAYLEQAFEHMTGIPEKPSIEYRTIGEIPDDADAEDITTLLLRRLESARQRERQQGRTLVGPHRDEMIFALDELEVRRYASQGQHRTFGLALKLAQYLYLAALTNQKPLLLLDDVFDQLDDRRCRVVLNLILSDLVGQTIITTAHLRTVLDGVTSGIDIPVIPVRDGQVAVPDSATKVDNQAVRQEEKSPENPETVSSQ